MVLDADEVDLESGKAALLPAIASTGAAAAPDVNRNDARLYKLAYDGRCDALEVELKPRPGRCAARQNGSRALYAAAQKGHDRCVAALLDGACPASRVLGSRAAPRPRTPEATRGRLASVARAGRGAAAGSGGRLRRLGPRSLQRRRRGPKRRPGGRLDASLRGRRRESHDRRTPAFTSWRQGATGRRPQPALPRRARRQRRRPRALTRAEPLLRTSRRRGRVRATETLRGPGGDAAPGRDAVIRRGRERPRRRRRRPRGRGAPDGTHATGRRVPAGARGGGGGVRRRDPRARGRGRRRRRETPRRPRAAPRRRAGRPRDRDRRLAGLGRRH